VRLRIDPTHAGSFARIVSSAAMLAQGGESVEVRPHEQEGSGLVIVGLRPLDPSKPVRNAQPAFGSMKLELPSADSDEVKAAVDAAFPGLPGGMTLEEAERRVYAAISAFSQASRGARVA
jgi:hypothetical protein